MKKILFILLLILFLIAAIYMAAILLQKEKKENIKIGGIISLSGPGQIPGEEARNGMLLAIKEINFRGGINERKIELIIEDSKSNPEAGIEAFNKIEVAHKPNFYISNLSSVSVALAPTAEQIKVPLIGIITAAPELTKDKEWVFRHFHTAENEVPPIISILKNLQVSRLGLIYLNDAFGNSISRILKEKTRGTSINTIEASFEMKDKEFKEQIARLKTLEAIYVVGLTPHIKGLVTQLRADGYNGYILAPSTITVPSLKSLPMMNGVYTAAPLLYDPGFIFAKEIKEKYEEEYQVPFSHHAGNGYNLIKIIEGLFEDKEISRDNIRQILESGFTYHGVFGTLEVEPGEHEMNYQLYPAQIVKNEVKYLD